VAGRSVKTVADRHVICGDRFGYRGGGLADVEEPAGHLLPRADFGEGSKPLGIQIYRININEGLIFDRQRVEAEDTCLSESFEPI